MGWRRVVECVGLGAGFPPWWQVRLGPKMVNNENLTFVTFTFLKIIDVQAQYFPQVCQL